MTDPSAPSDPTPRPAAPGPWQPPEAPPAWQPPSAPAAGGWGQPGAPQGQPGPAAGGWAPPGGAVPGPYQAYPAPGAYPSGPTIAPMAPPPPKKSNTGLVIGIIAGVVLLVVCLCAIGGVLMARSLSEAANRVHTYPTYDPYGGYGDEPSPDASPTTGRGHTVEYRITGKGTAKISFQTPAGYNTATAPLPWTRSWTGYGSYLRTSVSATVPGTAAITCVIVIDGKEADRQTGKGSVTCIRDLEV
ncbi:hypothetical protein Cs7R123_34500 [Catellatospora sp. TT07R-123]|uniref:hypothetical protein n=1 Tax=Catellatospora sp. TT07R-123 TaxID=2733863 RepID=UPI001B0821B8|nr:hypothetical protein [Catellatospora sp. TT07R-123]GHJ46108.1 hypothetical protein Cs7R123_34500 [Catellatospora sp. TT07R-123]